MNSDTLLRDLRQLQSMGLTALLLATAKDAADEIERLRAELKAFTNADIEWQDALDAAVDDERERWTALLSASRRIAEQHIKRADDCGMLSRALLDALKVLLAERLS